MVGLLVVLAFGVRPALRRVHPLTALAQTAAKELAAGTATAAGVPQVMRALEPAEIDPERLRAQEIFEQVSGHLKREPTQSSRLLQSWIHSD
jgi:flagellar M-ring protein FliF